MPGIPRSWRAIERAALALLHEWTESEALRRHAYAVEAAVRAVRAPARRRRGRVGQRRAAARLRLRAPPDPRQASAGRRRRTCASAATRSGSCGRSSRTPTTCRTSRRARATSSTSLFACDELAGFVHACALVRPEGLSTLEPRSVRKKLKQKSFASGVNREDVIEGARGAGRRPRRAHPGRDRGAAADRGRARAACVARMASDASGARPRAARGRARSSRTRPRCAPAAAVDVAREHARAARAPGSHPSRRGHRP